MKTLGPNFPATAKITGSGHLEIGGVDCDSLAKNFGTPLYVMDQETLIAHAREYSSAFKTEYPNTLVLYATKALAVRAILALLEKEGLGFDLSSSGEVLTAKKAGANLSKTVLHGNNKLPHELEMAVRERVGWIVVDHLQELEAIHALARKFSRRVPILLRVNPGIEAHTHSFIQTGQVDSKFGLPQVDLERAGKILKTLPNIDFQGIHAHIGSQILDLEGFSALVNRTIEFMEFFKGSFGLRSRVINLGGGLGIPYLSKEKSPSISTYVKRLAKALKKRLRGRLLGIQLQVEPGRSIVGTAGVSLYRVGVVKRVPGFRTYVSVDGGMADNPRPILYDAKYHAVLANRMNDRGKNKLTVVGRYCESGDYLLKDVILPDPDVGDLLVVPGTGAYTYSMASNYNRVPRPAMVMVSKGKARLIVKRETDEDLQRLDLG